MTAGRRRVLAAAVLGLLAAWTALWLYDRRQGPTGAWLEAAGLTARYAEVDGLRVRYVRAGRGSPVLLLHGFASSIVTWRAVLPGLAERHDVVALDLPGFGGSEIPAGLAPRHLLGAAAGLAARLGLERPALVGHSLGGALAVELASRPELGVRRLALLDAATFAMARAERPRAVRLVSHPAVVSVLESLPLQRLSVWLSLREVYFDRGRVSRELVDEYAAPLRRPGFGAALCALFAHGDDLAAGLAARAAALRLPVLVLWGREDAWIPLAHGERHARAIPGARLVVLERCGHLPQEEQPEETLARLLEFLEEPGGPPPG